MVTIISRAIIVKDGEVLLLKKPGSSFWHYPGGKWEEIESVQECAVREVKEETGLEVETGKMVFFQEYRKNGNVYLEFFWKSKVVGGELQLKEDEIAGALWVSKYNFWVLDILPKEINPHEY